MVQEYAIAAIAVGNVLLLRANLFPLLEKDSFVMSHMDPSDIIATPFPLHEMCTYVALSLAWNLAVAVIFKMMMNTNNTQQSHPQQPGVFQIILMIGLWTISVHFIFILGGIHPTMCPLRTLVSAFYVAFNMLVPILLINPACVILQNQDVKSQMKEVVRYLFGPLSLKKDKQSTQKQQHIHQYTTLGTIIGMGACSILRVLDHGMQTQRYPLPIIIGATWGCCGGAILGTLMRMTGIGFS